MTREDFRDWMEAYDCLPDPIHGLNIRGNAVRFVNRNNNRYTYVSTPINDFEMPDNLVRHCCTQLLIPFPDCVAIIEEEPGDAKKNTNQKKDKPG